jgi:hypothetical protein
MRLRQGFLYFCSLIACTALAPLWAPHAQTIGWLDRLFTFREEQRPATQPGARASRPTYVVQPSYSGADHVPWSQFYTNPTLAAQDYMIGSASKVMRPANASMAAVTGPDMIGQRALANARAAQPDNIQIGEPGEFLPPEGTIGRGTQVGAPTKDWREPGKPNLTSRPGDYDYETSTPREAPLAPGGEVLTETPSQDKIQSNSNLPTRNSANKVTRYTVQRGDTLGSIAAQPEIYGEAALWPLLYSANRKAIGKSPLHLKPKTVLRIPRGYTAAQAQKARRYAGRK